MNVGNARYWLCEETPYGPVVVGLFMKDPPSGQLNQFTIDRGPVNQWTGLPHNEERPPAS